MGKRPTLGGVSADPLLNRPQAPRSDCQSFQSNLHLFASRIGYWPVRWFGTPQDQRLEWLANKHMSFSRQISPEARPRAQHSDLPDMLSSSEQITRRQRMSSAPSMEEMAATQAPTEQAKDGKRRESAPGPNKAT